MLTQKQIKLLNKNRVVVLATADKRGQPRAIFVEVNKIEKNCLIITDNEMKTTGKNLLENKKVAILAFSRDWSWCLKIEGTANYYKGGKYFDLVKKLPANKDYSPKGALVIKIKRIWEL